MRNNTARAFIALTVLLSAGCGDIFSLKQSSSTQIAADGLYKPANAQLLVNGVIADFECAYTRVVTGMGLLGDEIQNAWANNSNYDYERRTISASSGYASGCTNEQIPGFYTSLSTARGMADTVYVELSGWTDEEVPNRNRLLTQAAIYGAYSIVMLGEAMCSAAINVGPELTPAQLFEEALIRFDRAVTHAAAVPNEPNLMHFAKLGRARALLNLGRYADAATDAATIPSSFVQGVSTDATYSRRQNIVYMHITQTFFGTVDPSYRNLTLGGAPDPRVAVTNSGRVGNVGGIQIWTPNKYPTVTSSIPVARYAEAQLIVAEARIAANDLTGAATAINNARNNGRTGMPQFSAAGMTQQQVLDQLIEERRRELFLEGHRFWDVRRFNLPLVPAVGTAYPAGGTYADLRCFPLPNIERSRNPNID